MVGRVNTLRRDWCCFASHLLVIMSFMSLCAVGQYVLWAICGQFSFFNTVHRT